MSMTFLTFFLGEDGASVLSKTCEKIPTIANALVPQAIDSWLSAIESYVGPIDNKSVELYKNEQGLFSGKFQLDETNTFDFVDQPNDYVTAAMAVVYGLDKNIPSIPPKQLQKLNKTVDLLVKFNLFKEEPVSPQAVGGAAKIGVIEPIPPVTQATQPKPTIATKTVKKPGIKIKKTEIVEKCGVCGTKNFYDDTLRGCLCVRSLLKTMQMELTDDSYLLKYEDLTLDDANFVVEALCGI
jgi:hypothetical protein